MKDKRYFPKIDRGFLAQTEELMKKGEEFRKNRNWSSYLTKLQLNGFKYIIIGSNSVEYSDVEPSEVRPIQIINIDKEIALLAKPVEVDERVVSVSFMGQDLMAPGHGNA